MQRGLGSLWPLQVTSPAVAIADKRWGGPGPTRGCQEAGHSDRFTQAPASLWETHFRSQRTSDVTQNLLMAPGPPTPIGALGLGMGLPPAKTPHLWGPGTLPPHQPEDRTIREQEAL